MTTTESVLIVIIIIMIVMFAKHYRDMQADAKAEPMQHNNPGVIIDEQPGVRRPDYKNPEAASIAENMEYFAAPAGDSSGEHTCDDHFSHATNEYGAPGMDFKDWVAGQAVDSQVIKNHAEFVKDRLGDGKQSVTGRTFSPDSHSSYDPISWVGLRRPQAVKVDNPTQVPDVDMDLYEKRPTFTWSSSN